MFGTKAVWGVNIGESGVKAVKVARVDKARVAIQDFAVVRYAELQSDPPVERAELVRRAVTRIAARVSRGDRLVAGIPSENVLSRFIGLPPVDKRKIPEVVRYEARQQIPFDLSEVVWDYQRVRKELVPGEEIEIGLFAVRREVVAHFLDLLKPLHRNLTGLQINPLSVYNFVRYDQQPETPLVVLDIGANSTDLIVVDGPKFWIRNLPIAGNSFTQILQKKFNISFDEAESVKYKVEQSRYRAQIFDVLRPVIHDLIGEVQRSIGYYKTLSREAKFEEILVLGQGYRLFGLNRVMSEELQYRIRFLDKPKTLELPPAKPDEFKQAMPGLGAALGSAIYGMKLGDVTISILPDDFSFQREVQHKQVPAVAAGLMLWAAVGLMYYGGSSAARGLAQFEGRGKDKIDRAGRADAEYQAAFQQTLQAQLGRYDNLLLWRDYWCDVLHAFVNAIPHRDTAIYIDGIDTAGAPIGGGPGAGGVARGAPVAAVGQIPEQGPVFSFRADTSFRNGKEALTVMLKDALEKATVYPEKVKLFKSVTVSDQVTYTAGAPTRAAGAAPDAEGVAGGGAAMAASVLSTRVECACYSPKELRQMRLEARNKAKTEAAGRGGGT